MNIFLKIPGHLYVQAMGLMLVTTISMATSIWNQGDFVPGNFCGSRIWEKDSKLGQTRLRIECENRDIVFERIELRTKQAGSKVERRLTFVSAIRV